MTTTEPYGGYVPPPPPSPGPRVLRRSRNDRIAAGVSGGLGEYFDVDPVLFRVLFATAAFFGGAGLLAYVLAWVAIPEQGTRHAPIDRFVGEIRRRRVPLWIVMVVGALALWGIAFSWWVPWHAFPVLLLVLVLIAIFARRGRYRRPDTPASGPSAQTPWTAPPSTGDATAAMAGDAAQGDIPAGSAPTALLGETPAWQDDARQWVSEAKEASRERRRRAAPVRIATFSTLLAVLAVLAAVDAGAGIPIPSYFWAIGAIAVGGFLVGLILRRTPWSVAPLIIPAIIGLVAFAPTGVSLHDGMGQRDWTPTSESTVHGSYTLAFGQGVLDLTHLGTVNGPHSIDVKMAAGQVRVIMPATMNATVLADVHIGAVEVDGQQTDTTSGWHSHGWGIQRTVLPQAGATGTAITIHVHLADGNVSVDHRS